MAANVLWYAHSRKSAEKLLSVCFLCFLRFSISTLAWFWLTPTAGAAGAAAGGDRGAGTSSAASIANPSPSPAPPASSAAGGDRVLVLLLRAMPLILLLLVLGPVLRVFRPFPHRLLFVSRCLLRDCQNAPESASLPHGVCGRKK